MLHGNLSVVSFQYLIPANVTQPGLITFAHYWQGRDAQISDFMQFSPRHPFIS